MSANGNFSFRATPNDTLLLISPGVKFVGTEYQAKYPDLKPGIDIRVDASGFIVAGAAASRQFQAKNYLDPLPLQQIQLSNGTLT